MFPKLASVLFSGFIMFFFASGVFAQARPDSTALKKVDVLFFTSPYCGHCQKMKREFLQRFIRRHKDEITVHDFDTTTADGSIAYAETAKLYGQKDDGVPAVFIGDSFLIGYPDDIGSKADEAVNKALENGEVTRMGAVRKISSYKNLPDFMKFVPQNNAPQIAEGAVVPASIQAPQENTVKDDNGSVEKNESEQKPSDDGVHGASFTLSGNAGDSGTAGASQSRDYYRSKFSEITLWAIISAGLADGINPCAFAVIIFFVSFLAVYKYNRREIIAVGGAYCFAVFLTYLLLGLGLFRFLYAFQGFQAVMLAFKYLTIALCAVFFLLTLYDFIIYQKTKNADRVLLQLSRKNKERIHKVTRFFMRDKEKSLFRLTCAAFVSGIIISLVEAVCTGQVYLPTIALILKDTGSGYFWRAAEYLLIYNLMFIVPLVAVLALTIAGYEAKGFNAFLKKYLGLTKALLCLVFLVLLILLLKGI